MLHDSDARHVHVRLEFGQRATFTLEEKIEQKATCRVGERLKNEVVVHIQPIYVTIWLPVKYGINARRSFLSVFATLNVSACFDLVNLRSGLSDNVLWAPTNLERALALAAKVAPWLMISRVAPVRHRNGPHRINQKSAVK